MIILIFTILSALNISFTSLLVFKILDFKQKQLSFLIFSLFNLVLFIILLIVFYFSNIDYDSKLNFSIAFFILSFSILFSLFKLRKYIYAKINLLDHQLNKQTKELVNQNTILQNTLENQKNIEIELLNQQEKYHTLIQRISEVIVLLDRNQKIIQITSSHENLIGYKIKDDSISFNTLISEDAIEKFNTYFNIALAHPNKPFVLECSLKNIKTKLVFAEIIITNYCNNPSINGIILNIKNITEKRIAEYREDQHLKDLVLLNKTALEFFDISTSEESYKLIANKINSFLGHKAIVIVNDFETTSNTFTTVAFSGNNFLLAKINQLLIKNLIGYHYLVRKNITQQLLSTHLHKTHSDIYKLSLGNIKKDVAEKIKKEINFNNAYIIGFTRQGTLFGNAVILTKTEAEIENKQMIENFASQASIALHRIKIQEKYTENQEITNRIIDASPEAIVLCNLDGIITYASSKAAETFDCNNQIELKETSIFERIDKDYQLKAINDFNALTHKQFSFENSANIGNEYVMIKNNQQKFYAEVNSVIIRDLQGRPKNIVSIIRDISINKLEKIRLQQTELLLNEAQKMARIGSFEIDLLNNKTIFSESLYSLLKINSDEIKNNFTYQKFLSFIHEEDREKYIALRSIYINNKNTGFNISFKIIDFEQKTIFVKLIGTIDYDENNYAIRNFNTLQDVSDQIKNEELIRNIEIAKQSTQIKQQFLANMSHEMRTPLNGVLGMVEFLLQTKLDEKQYDYALTIRNSSENLLNIVNDILDLSKIEAGKTIIKPSVFDIIDTFKKTKNPFSVLINQKNLDFNLYIDENTPQFVKSDKHRLMQIVNNLVSNALKFTEIGSISVNLYFESKSISKYSFKVEVIDTGIGISIIDQQKLFTSFTQLDSTFSRSYEGTGLGLFISKSLVKALGGEIGVNSNTNKGSNFWFTFTCDIPTKEEIQYFQEHENTTTKITNLNQKILLVEDKYVNQKVISMMLEKMNCDAIVANNGKEAIDIYEKNQTLFDIILMDIQMPVMDGVTAVKHLKNDYSNLPPIIGLSANAVEGDAEYYISQGLDDYIAKPVFSDVLFLKLKKWANTSKIDSTDFIQPENVEKQIIPLQNTDENYINDETLTILKEQIGAEDEIIKELFQSFINDADSLISKLENAFNINNEEEYRIANHSIKGLAGTMGADQLHECTQTTDKLLKQKNIVEAFQKFNEIINLYTKTRAFILQKYFN